MPRHTSGLLYSALTAGILGTLSHTYHNTVLNNAGHLIKQFVNESVYVNYGTQLTSTGLSSLFSFAIAGIWGVGAVIGAPVTYFVIEKTGRKNALMLWNNVIVFISCMCFLLAQPTFRFELVSAGRFLFGVAYSLYGIGYALYITESAPDETR